MREIRPRGAGLRDGSRTAPRGASAANSSIARKKPSTSDSSRQTNDAPASDGIRIDEAQAAGEMEWRERVADVVRPQAEEVDHRVGEVQHLPVPERRELRPTGRARGHQHVGVLGARERLDGVPDARLDLERERSVVAGNGAHRRHAEGRGGDAQRMTGLRRREHRLGTHPAKQRSVRVGRERRAQRRERRGGRQ